MVVEMMTARSIGGFLRPQLERGKPGVLLALIVFVRPSFRALRE
jgi:hypothetical protein